MSAFSHRSKLLFLCVALAAASVLAPGRSDASPPAGFGTPQQVANLTSCIGQSATAADGTDVVFAEGGNQNDITFTARIRRPGTATWHLAPTVHVPAYSLFDTRMVAIGSSDVLLAIAWYDASGLPRFSVYRLNTRSRTWSSASNAFPKLTRPGYYEEAAIGVTAAGGIVAATTHAVSDPAYHYSVMVAYRAPGSSTWQRATYSSASSWQFADQVAVSRNGYVAIPFTVEASGGSPQTGIGVISRSPGSTHWRRQVVDTSGTVYRRSVAVGADGEALLAFSSTGHDVSVARTVLPAGNAMPVWSTQSVTTSTAYPSDVVWAAVDGRGHGTVLIDDHTPPTYAHLDGATLTGPFPFGNGARRDINDLVVRPDGTAEAATGEFTSDPSPVFTGEDAVSFPSNGTYRVQTLETAGNPWSNGHASILLGSDAANRIFATFTTGNPSPDQCQFADQPGKPDVMTSPSSGRYVLHTHTHRLAHHRLRCVSGFWVEARSLAYRWYRDGHRIRGASGAVYRRVAADTGHHVTCRVLATNTVGTRVLGP